MLSLNFAHPLQWPHGYPRTEMLAKSINRTFKMGMTIQEALTFLYEELQQMGVKKATLYTDYENIEKPSSMRRIGSDNGATIQFELSGHTYRIACDRWSPIEQNIYSLHLALRNLRMVVEWGVGNVENVFGGYSSAVQNILYGVAQGGSGGADASSGGGAANLEEWRLTLGLGPTATLDDAQAVYRRRAKGLADKPDELMKLNLAMDSASKALGM
jgi:hypothetical protein